MQISFRPISFSEYCRENIDKTLFSVLVLRLLLKRNRSMNRPFRYANFGVRFDIKRRGAFVNRRASAAQSENGGFLEVVFTCLSIESVTRTTSAVLACLNEQFH
jgi:hypothetical protein